MTKIVVYQMRIIVCSLLAKRLQSFSSRRCLPEHHFESEEGDAVRYTGLFEIEVLSQDPGGAVGGVM
jgi:hypothetical protein